MRTCSKCQEAKPLDQFSKKLNGLQPNCKPCSKEIHRAWNLANREQQCAKKREYYQSNRETALERQKQYYVEHREQVLTYIEKWRAERPGYAADLYAKNAERQKERTRTWRKENPDLRKVQETARRARTRRLPPWADRKAMAAIYSQAKELREMGIDCHVDHVIPLKGKTVSGLHVHTNLQILLATENLKKGVKV
jgi:hypothetical protein